MSPICCGMTLRSTAGGFARGSALGQPGLGTPLDAGESPGDHGFHLSFNLFADQGDFTSSSPT